MSIPARPWSRLFVEFYCSGCGGDEAYRSRPRGPFERYLLPLTFFQPVRCERCYHRTYALKTIPVIDRMPRVSVTQSEQPSDTNSRVA
jgi:hypothetical protein